MVGRQSNAPAAFTPEEIPGNHFQRLSRPQGPVTPPEIDPGTSRPVAQCLNHYATPGLLLVLVVVVVEEVVLVVIAVLVVLGAAMTQTV